MSDIYSAPDAELREEQGESLFGSVEKGVAGDYELSIGGIFSEAGSRLKGSKRTLWLAVILMVISAIAIQFVATFLLGLLPLPVVLSGVLVQVVITLFTTPISVGMILVAVKLAADAQASGTSIFNYFHMMIKLFLQALLMYLLIFIGFVLLVLPGIYLTFAYMFSATLMVEKNMGIWEAMEVSRKAVTHKWFTLFFTWIIIFIMIVVSFIPLGIGLIWTVPLSMLCFGVAYKTLFGVEKSTLDSE